MFSLGISRTNPQSPFLRWMLALGYTLLGAAGALLLLSPAVAETYGLTSYFYAGFICLGALLGLFSTLTLRWIGEFTGLPLLAAGFVAYAVEVLGYGWPHGPLLALANFCLLSGLAVLMLARWRRAAAVFQLAYEGSKKGRPDDDQ